MKRFKAEYQNAQVTINSPSFGRMRIDTETADPNQWATVKEFEFMIEDDIEEEPVVVVKKQVQKDDYSELTLGELREMFPDIKATSKKDFIAQIL
jgi:hypothetical protein